MAGLIHLLSADTIDKIAAGEVVLIGLVGHFFAPGAAQGRLLHPRGGGRLRGSGRRVDGLGGCGLLLLALEQVHHVGKRGLFAAEQLG